MVWKNRPSSFKVLLSGCFLTIEVEISDVFIENVNEWLYYYLGICVCGLHACLFLHGIAKLFEKSKSIDYITLKHSVRIAISPHIWWTWQVYSFSFASPSPPKQKVITNTLLLVRCPSSCRDLENLEFYHVQAKWLM